MFMMIKDHQKHDFGDEKTGIEEEEYEENFTKYSGQAFELSTSDAENNVEGSINIEKINDCTKGPNMSASRPISVIFHNLILQYDNTTKIYDIIPRF